VGKKSSSEAENGSRGKEHEKERKKKYRPQDRRGRRYRRDTYTKANKKGNRFNQHPGKRGVERVGPPQKTKKEPKESIILWGKRGGNS